MRVSDRGGDAIDDDNTVEGAVPAVGPDGRVYLAWSGPRGLEFDRSTNGGASWGVDQVISDQPGGWNITIPGIYRCNGFPVTKADASAGPFHGRLYVLWSDQRNGDTDVFLRSSDDGGETWGPRVRVNDDPVGNGAHQFFPWMDVDPVTGTIAVVFYDRREHPGSELTDVYVARSGDGGVHFSQEKVSATPFDPRPDVFFGDYIGIAAYGGWVRPFWVRMDDNQLSVWTALMDPDSSGVGVEPGPFTLRVVPNPVRRGAAISFWRAGAAIPTQVESAGSRWLRIADASGRIVRSLRSAPGLSYRDRVEWDGRDDGGRLVPSGVYYVASGHDARGRFVVVR